jgi:hypothetical protein
MPYIKPERRDRFFAYDEPGDNSGELNYLITQKLLDYLAHKGLSYQTINDITGALEGAKLEFTRRITVPYEETKRAQNGDVYCEEYWK